MNNRRKRREVTKQWHILFDAWRADSRKYGAGDPFNTVETIELFENLDDDKSADVVIACDVLEHLADPIPVLWKMKALAKKFVAFLIKTDAIRDIPQWKAIIGKVFPIPPHGVTPLMGGLVFIVAPNINVFGHGDGKVVAAGTPEGRWENILFNTAAIKLRIPRWAPHHRRAIVACYGPSIKYNLDLLRQEDGDIISVSGAHDFLLGHNIQPVFHVECDPRPHKADNIAVGVAGVRYLLGSSVHPVLTQKLAGCHLELWHPSGEFNYRIKDTLEPEATFVSAFLNVGLTSLSLFYQLGYRQFSIYGMDCSFEGENIWAGPHAQKQNQKQQQVLDVVCGGRPFKTSAIYISYANAFFDLIKVMRDGHFNVYGDNLLRQMSCEYMNLAASEKAA